MKIEWTEPAVLDLESVRDYIRIGSEYFAARFVERILEAVENLAEFPEMGRSVPEADQENIRELVFHNYRIMYRVEKAEYFVNTVLPNLPIKVVPNTLQDVLEAARIKATHSISYADCFVVATALKKDAAIVTGDPEFKKVQKTVEIEWM